MVKRIIVAIMCVLIFIISLTCCSNRTWTIERSNEYWRLLVSPEGEKYHPWGYDYYISGLRNDKLLGKLDLPYDDEEYSSDEERKSQLAYLELKRKIYSVSALDDSIVVQYSKNSSAEKYSSCLDGRCICEIYFKFGEEYEFDYRNTNVSSAAFIPYDDIPDEGMFDYAEYVSKHGIFDDEAKETISSILFDKSEEDIFSQESKTESFEIICNSKEIGRLVYYTEDADWFCYDGGVYCNTDGRLYLGIYRAATYDIYLIPDDAAKKLGIDVD